jgi:beta-glucanase (GH16 family)
MVFLSLKGKPQNIQFTDYPECPTDWTLVYEDNFDGTSLNSIWEVENAPRNYNDDNIYFSANNVLVQNGVLKLMDRKEYIPNVINVDSWDDPNTPENEYRYHLHDYNYSSASIKTKQAYRYGLFEIRCKIEHGSNFWPAFWLFNIGNDHDYNEIDVFEFLQNTTNAKMTLHYPTISQAVGFNNYGPDYSLDYHVFSIEWDPYVIRLRIDGVIKKDYFHYVTLLGQDGIECQDIEPGITYAKQCCFPDDALFVIINTAISQANPPNDYDLPASLDVDYVRFYTKHSIQDVSYCNLNLSDLNNSIITGKNITLGGTSGCSVIVHGPPQPWEAGEYLNLFATEKVHLLPGFKVNPGGNLIVKTTDNTLKSAPINSQFQENNNHEDAEKLIKDANLRIHPNPSMNGHFTLQKDNLEEGIIEIYNEEGILLKSSKINNPIFNLDISDCKKGIYFIRLKDRNSVVVSKIIYN